MSTYDKIDKDPFYRTRMAAVYGRWQKLADSGAFETAFGAAGAEAKEQLKNILYGAQDAYGSDSVEGAKEGITEAQKMKSFLSRKLPGGKTYYDALKKAAKDQKIPMKTFFEDLHFMNEKLDMGLDMPKLDKDLVVPKVRNIGEYNWENYAKAHLVSLPYSPKQKQEYLAKAMAGAFLAGEKKRNPNAKETPFSLASARNAAKYIMDKPGFKRLTADPSKVDKLLAEGAKDPDKLFDEAVRVNRPFYNIGRDKTREILSNLKKMQPLMDGADAYDSKWAALQESISSIDLKSNDPALSGEMKLQEILNRTTDFMKGKKSLRKSEEHRNCFDQSLDVLAELAKGSAQAEAQAQVLIDRTNEVRKGHNKDHKPIGLRSYGMSNVWKHTNSEDDKLVEDYYNGLKYEDGEKPLIQRRTRYVFEEYPEGGDFSLLKRAPKGISPKKVRRGARDLHEFLEDKPLSHDDVKTYLAGIFSLSDCQMYFREAREIGKSDVVFDEGQYAAGILTYLADPGMDALATKYASPEARRALSGGSEDILSIKAGKIVHLKEELEAYRKEAEGPKAEGEGKAKPEGPKAEEGKKQGDAKPQGPQAGA